MTGTRHTRCMCERRFIQGHSSSCSRGRASSRPSSETFNGLPSPDAAYEWYQHAANWSNRIIHGESDACHGFTAWPESTSRDKVQMIYFDPPYGMGYKSNFQVSTDNRETPESAKGRPHDTRTVRAFRDTYQRGIHSYLDLTLEKLVLMREMLADSGSLFMQIGDENVHRAAVLLDEVFGAENRVATIPYATSGSSSSKTLPSVADYLLWYAKDKRRKCQVPSRSTSTSTRVEPDRTHEFLRSMS